MKKLMNILSVVIVMILISACGAEAEPLVEPVAKVPIKLASMKKDVVEKTYIAVGEVVPSNQVDLYINGGGFVESIEVATGDYVEEDQILILLDDSDVDRTNYNATESQLRTVRDNLSGQLTSLKDNLSKQRVLYEEGLITFNEYNQSQLQVESLQRDYDNARNAYWNQLKIIDNGLSDAAESRIFESPIAGIVASVTAQEGQGVNGQLAMTIVDTDQLFVETYISSDLKKLLAIGDKVRLSLSGEDRDLHIGTIHEIKGLPDPATKLFEVLIEIDEAEAYIVGDYAEIEFILERYEATMVPTASIVRSGESKYVYIYEDDMLIKTLLEAGQSSDTWIEFKNRKDLGQVVVLGQNQLAPSSEFELIE